MATPANINMAQQLFVAYYGRPADKAGLNYWAEQIENNGVNAAVNGFSSSAEFDERFGDLSEEQLVNNLYNQMFGRNAELAGLNYYADQLKSGDSSLGQIALTIASGAQNADKQALDNKVAVANKFTDSIDTTEELLAYQGSDAANQARDFLSQVNADTDVDSVDAEAALQDLVEDSNPGDEFTLTKDVDNIKGTDGNDTINALSTENTLTSFDKIDGGAGKDTLNIYTTNSFNSTFPSNASVKNVETVNIYNEEDASDLADASKYQGVEQLWQIGSAGGVTKLEESTTAGFRNTTDASGLSVAAAAKAATANVALDNVAEGATLAVSGDALNSVAVSGALVDGDDEVGALKLNVTAGKDQQTVNVNSAVDAALAVNDGTGKPVTNVDASASKGSIDYSAEDSVSAIKTGAGNDTVTLSTAFSDKVKTASVATGEGIDSITVDAIGKGDVTVDAGAGNDTISIDAINGKATINAGAGDDVIKLGTNLNLKNAIDGGEGNDTVELSATEFATQSYDAINAFQNIETLAFSGEGEVDAAQLSDFSAFTFTAASATVSNVAADQTVTAESDDDQELTIEGKIAGTVNVNAVKADEKVEASTLTLNVIDDKTPADSALNLTGDNNVSIEGGAFSTVDASDLKGTLDYTNVAGVKESITLGEDNGSDTLNVDAGSTYGSMDVITNFDSTIDEDPDSAADVLSGIFGDGNSATEVELGDDISSLNQAFAAAAGVEGTDIDGNVFFSFDDNTYVFNAGDNGQYDNDDFAIQLAGIHDLSSDNNAYNINASATSMVEIA